MLNIEPKVRFFMGRLYATDGAIDALNEGGASAADYIRRHATGDWGEVSEGDAQANEYAVGNDLRILSAYTLRTGTRIWLITEADRSATTLLLPDELRHGDQQGLDSQALPDAFGATMEGEHGSL